MSFNADELIARVTTSQAQVWQTASLTVSEAIGHSVAVEAGPAEVAAPAEVIASMSEAAVTIEFSFAHLADHPQLLILPADTAGSLAALIKGEPVEGDEALVAELHGAAEAFVQGICLAAGSLRNEAVLAGGMSVRFQQLSLPANLQEGPELLRVQVGLAGEGVSGKAFWLFDWDTAQSFFPAPEAVEGENVIFADFGDSGDSSQGSASRPESGGLDLLMDIPLEISVELGRVKMVVRDVLDLGAGSIVEIDKAAGEPVDVFVNGRVVARGEVVVIEDNFGVRITEILNPQERVSRLSEVA